MKCCRPPSNTTESHNLAAPLSHGWSGIFKGAEMTRSKSMEGFGALAGICVYAVLYIAQAPAAVGYDNAHWGANYFPNVELTTQDGKKVRLYDDLIRGKIV